MSLDVYLKTKDTHQHAVTGIFIREAGATKEISRTEWDEKHPGQEPVTCEPSLEDHVAFHANITHNLCAMASDADLYQAMWHPEELNITKAKQLIATLTDGLALLKSDPERFKALNPSNGWGSYDGLVTFVKKYLDACAAHPEADVEAST